MYVPTVDARDLRTKETDDRGRIYLGTEYANKRVTVAVVDVESDGPDEDELAAAYRDASERGVELAEEWSEASDEAWDELDERARSRRSAAETSSSSGSTPPRSTR